VREGNTRGLFEKRTVASLLTGEPEYMIPLGDETPEAVGLGLGQGADGGAGIDAAEGRELLGDDLEARHSPASRNT
jgi:hypothetical protein